MKQVKSKITGDIGDLDLKEGVFIVVCYDLNTKEMVKKYYESLEDLCEEWEDIAEEPKDIWWIDNEGFVNYTSGIHEDCFEKNKEIGNYFETKEEAEKAVEKLKAWKRLKDNGFKFEGIEKRGHHINLYQGKSYETDKQCQQAMNDLDLLFGGEE